MIHSYTRQMTLLKTQIEETLRYVEHIRSLKGDTEAEAVAEADLKSLLSFHLKEVEESQQQRGVWVQGCDGSLGPIAIKRNFNKASEAIDHLKTLSKEELITELVEAGIAEHDSDSDIRPSTLDRRNFSLPPRYYRR
ncbi:hypothetical protein Xsto_03766 [Xenorhabdus stockiae]|uniref:Uncharacterized protein n=1 Tax=Xenorhabdus stockiae TaxID=351614 RepID=A0A2D0KBG5_9GAMM|nr:hypothetical protein [Xenorhabdus stockiae]PHM60655.1 hypothetical protein Xsto_03766 [Xenorhabdus stockiae]